MHIGIDARLYGLEHAGIGRYVMNLIASLQHIDTLNDYTLFVRRQNDQIPSNHHWHQVAADIRHYTLKEQFEFPRIIRDKHIDLMHFPHFNVPLLYRAPFVVTIHDLLWHEFRGLSVTTLNPLMYLVKYGGYRLTVNHALRAARHILVPSNWVGQKLKTDFRITTDKITVTYEGIATTFGQPADLSLSQSLLLRFNLTEPFVVYTGSAYPHKNILKLFESLKLLMEQSIKLQVVIVSSRSPFLDQLKGFVNREGLDKQVVFAGYLTDIEIRALYAAAQALVHPSLSEGFGLTGIEAMAAGLPVISSHAGSLPEIYQDAALYFDPQDAADLAKKIKLILTDTTLVNQLKAAGRRVVKRYTWAYTAQTTLKIYDQVTAPS